MVYTRGKRKLDEAEGKVVVIREGAVDPNLLFRDRRKKSKRQKQEEPSTYKFFDFISADLKRHILSFVRQGRYVILASVSQDFRATLKSMPENDFKTHPRTYVWRWKLTKWIINYPPGRPQLDMIPSPKKTIVHAIQYDMLHVFQKLMKAVKWGNRDSSSWTKVYAIKAMEYNSMQIFKWIIQDQAWDYKAHKNTIASNITYCNRDMLRYLHDVLEVDFNDFKAIKSMIMKPSVRNVDAIRYVLDVVPTLTTLTQRRRGRLSRLCVQKEDMLVYNMLREKLHDPEDDPDILVIAMYECCLHRKTMNIVKCIVDEEAVKQMKDKQYLRLIDQVVHFGRLDILMYLEEEVSRIPKLHYFMDFALFRNHRDVADYLVMLEDTRRD
ncbi:predicted protein [Chaetoceros tenuissimus]|uniref:Uncharacterized protein n=1 Tax=Chaetoceros tenuissimus TaxID=426638 RepID=A0AAD3DCW2_9STRA|nr:predicted protein [Chaetoceros tenuissimus]